MDQKDEHTVAKSSPQQHRREAKPRTCRVSRGPDLSPDSDSARERLQKSSLGSKFGPQHMRSQGGTKVDTGPAESDPVYNRRIIEIPISRALFGGKQVMPSCSMVLPEDPAARGGPTEAPRWHPGGKRDVLHVPCMCAASGSMRTHASEHSAHACVFG
mgnify:CR=1 FL=1